MPLQLFILLHIILRGQRYKIFIHYLIFPIKNIKKTINPKLQCLWYPIKIALTKI